MQCSDNIYINCFELAAKPVQSSIIDIAGIDWRYEGLRFYVGKHGKNTEFSYDQSIR